MQKSNCLILSACVCFSFLFSNAFAKQNNVVTRIRDHFDRTTYIEPNTPGKHRGVIEYDSKLLNTDEHNVPPEEVLEGTFPVYKNKSHRQSSEGRYSRSMSNGINARKIQLKDENGTQIKLESYESALNAIDALASQRETIHRGPMSRQNDLSISRKKSAEIALKLAITGAVSLTLTPVAGALVGAGLVGSGCGYQGGGYTTTEEVPAACWDYNLYDDHREEIRAGFYMGCFDSQYDPDYFYNINYFNPDTTSACWSDEVEYWDYYYYDYYCNSIDEYECFDTGYDEAWLFGNIYDTYYDWAYGEYIIVEYQCDWY